MRARCARHMRVRGRRDAAWRWSPVAWPSWVLFVFEKRKLSQLSQRLVFVKSFDCESKPDLQESSFRIIIQSQKKTQSRWSFSWRLCFFWNDFFSLVGLWEKRPGFSGTKLIRWGFVGQRVPFGSKQNVTIFSVGATCPIQ